MQKIKVRVFAKINLSLDVIGKRENGYHDLSLVNQSISLFDELTIESISEGIVLSSDSDIPLDHTNTAYSAADAYIKEAGLKGGFSIEIKKNIPVKAGLGGSSADAAAVLFGLNDAYKALSQERLLSIAAKIGADVPFMIMGGTMHCGGVGEVLEPLVSLPECSILLVKPSDGMDTKEAFSDYDRIVSGSSLDKIDHGDIIRQALSRGDLEGVARGLYNDLTPAVIKKHPEVEKVRDVMVSLGAKGASMTGSGTGVFGLFDDDFLMQICRDVISSDYESYEIFEVRAVDTGCTREF